MPKALSEFEAAQGIADVFSRRDPDDVNWQRELLRCRLHIARLPLWDGVRGGKPRPAQEDAASRTQRFRQQLAIFGDLAALSRRRLDEDPANAHWKKDLAMMRTQEGGARLTRALGADDPKEKEEHLRGAEQALTEALGHWKELVGRDATNAEYPQDLAQAQALLAQLWTARGDDARAAAAAEDARETSLAQDERMTGLYPDGEAWRGQAVSDAQGLLTALGEGTPPGARTLALVDRTLALLRKVKMRGQWKPEEDKVLQGLEAARPRLAGR